MHSLLIKQFILVEGKPEEIFYSQNRDKIIFYFRDIKEFIHFDTRYIDSIDCEYGLISISHQEYNHIIALNIKSIIAISRQYTDATIRKNHDSSITCWDTMNETIIKAIKEDLISQETNISPELSDDIVSLFSRL